MSNILKIEEVSKRIGATAQYTRELCRKGIIKAKKVGKEWSVDSKEVDKYLGITTNEEELKKEIYIKELESKVKHYEFVLGAIQGNITNIELMLTNGVRK
ncbi:helix-turn-helix domain-containing protein [Clostridium perfringens]|uniref:helix-turn-helix domain-containing protein n=1 Tax=Clostridium perfringens TaxID=1502 RepID=UPI0009945241|nr:helix-turn-helix domain-containing protein [Clostridium perfringens]WEV16113.1 helix-turn-helix domain-containing protein [Clostridium perfringens D]AQW22407.1 DNA-binding protein [Clostridium perfringens]ELC8420085.1 helix-turn-helix domain-containing protein [Clostridium perfringens]ELC8460552.1 helix-turn-helix domain-containing protein [Clostridium perfringens]MBO3405216.1 helix-turn-helix domain-containing protein [Clostridium perfringens]